MSTSRFAAFTVIWAGQFLSMLGSSLTAFALGVHVYDQTLSVTALGLVLFLSLLPTILASPFAGSLVDRWGPKRALLVSNAGNLVVTLMLALLLTTVQLAVWHICVMVSLWAVFAALEFPALAALTPRLVAKDQLGRANGMRMAASAVSQVLAPVSAGSLLLVIGLEGIVVADVVSFGLAIITLLGVAVPNPTKPDSGGAEPSSSLLAEFAEGWHYVAVRRGLLHLLIFFGALNLSAGFLDLLLTPLVLNFAESDGLGIVVSVGGVGLVVASIAVSVSGGPRRRVRAVFVFSLVLALATMVGAARPSVALVAVATFVFMGSLSVIISTNQTLWQTKVEPRLLGRVGALVGMVASVPQLLSYALAGPLVDRVVDPLVGESEVRSPTLALLIGDGPGRGVALLMMIIGVVMAITVVVAAMSPRLRRLETELPDAITDDEPIADEAGAAPDSSATIDGESVIVESSEPATHPHRRS